MGWVRACDASELDDGEAVVVVVEGEPDSPVAVFNVDGDFYAVDDTCTHEKFSLADGYIMGEIVECPLHMAKFEIRTGKVLSLPATKSLATYEVKVEGGVVYVNI